MLREKKDELSRLLLSRKRKLSELYYATVSSRDLEATTKSAQYLDNERLFLESNDIQQGHPFDISTLPARPPNTRTPPPTRKIPIPTFHHSPSTTTVIQSSSKSITPPTNRSVSPVCGPSLRSRSSSPVGGHEEKGLIERDTTGEGRPRSVDGMSISKLDEAVSLISGSPHKHDHLATIADALPKQQDLPEALRQEDPTANTKVQIRTIGDFEEPHPGSVTRHASPGRTPGDRSPHRRGPRYTAAEAQSSPASTNGAGSSNTPDVAAGSPTTSPGDEQGLDQLATLPAVKPSGPAHTSAKPTEPDRLSSPKSKLPGEITAMQAPATVRSNLDSSTHAASKPSTPDPAATDSQKPKMHIDTRAAGLSAGRTRDAGTTAESPMSTNSAFPPQRMPTSASVSNGQSPSGRITRISSGTIRQRSVSEILGERPKPSPPTGELSSVQTLISSTSREDFEAFATQSRLNDRKDRGNDRSRLSTVVFAKQQHPPDSSDSTSSLRKAPGEVAAASSGQRDYLHILFESKAYSPPRGQALNVLMQSAHKTLSTADHLIDYQEQMNCRTLKRIYQLQNASRWSLRQMRRASEPVRQSSHWDFLLDHAKWMRTDFREERKWKMAAAKGVAEWCAEWVSSGPRRRKQLQIKVRSLEIYTKRRPTDEVHEEDVHEVADCPAQHSHSLLPSADDESTPYGCADKAMDLGLSTPPAAIFSLNAADFSFPVSNTPATDKLLNELPLYEPARIEPDLSRSDLAERSDSRWKTDIVAISKLATGKIRYRPPKPPSKHSRYQYQLEDDSSDHVRPLPPAQIDVALFMPENKHIRDRIHPGHSFRPPPSEYPMPSQAFFESRTSSQWTQTEDDELRSLVKSYSYNWSLISSCLSTNSPYHSGADRRTPWECFERWINLEGLPADMSKTPYFRAYHSRIEAAGRHVIAQQEATQRQIGGNPSLTNRKRTTQPIRVERKKNQRHLAMLDAMRKLAKHRESAIQKQQHAADLAAMRKVNDADRPRPPISTPAEFSRLKHDRDVKLAERQEMYRLQVLAHQKATMQQRSAQMNQVHHPTNGGTRPGSGLPSGGLAGTSGASLSNGLSATVGASNQVRSQAGGQGLPSSVSSNGAFATNMMGPKGLTRAQMQAGLAAGRGLGTSPEHMRVLYEANRLQHQQQMMLAARQQQQQHHQHQQQGTANATGQHSSPNMPAAGPAGGNGNPGSPAFLSALGASNGVPSPSVQAGHANGVGTTGSPRLLNGHTVPSGVMPAISQLAASIQRQNPEASAEEIQRLAHLQLNAYHQQASHGVSQKSMNQAALNAAAGAANAGAHAANASSYGRPPGMMTNEQIQSYNAQLRQQQAIQRANGGHGVPPLGAGLGMNMNGHGGMGAMAGFTGSPVLNMSRPVSNHNSQGRMSRSATPRDQRAGSTGGSVVQGSPRVGPAQV